MLLVNYLIYSHYLDITLEILLAVCHYLEVGNSSARLIIFSIELRKQFVASFDADERRL